MARRYRAKSAYRMTSARKAALRKAQLESARKRKRNRNIKRAAVAVGVTAGVAGGAYLGYKHGGKGANIAADLKKRTPKNVAAAQKRVKKAVQPLAKEASLIRHGLTRGHKNGAGPDAGVSKPRVWKYVEVPQISASHQAALQAKAAAKPGPKIDDSGHVIRNSNRGIPVAIQRGRKLSQHKANQMIDRWSSGKVAAGGEGLTKGQKLDLLNELIADGNVRKTFYGRRQKTFVGTKGAYGKRNRVGALKNNNKPQPRNSSLKAFEQWIKDYG